MASKKIYEIRQLGAYIRGIHGTVRKATAKALFRTAVAATTQAKRNARDNFKGTKDRPKSGFLLNAIFTGFEMTSGKNRRIADAMVAVRSLKGNRGTRPYGRIHEYGGVIRPVKAKSLWIPLFGPKSSGILGRLRDMTPRDFVHEAKESDKAGAARNITTVRKSKIGKTGFHTEKNQKMKGEFFFYRSDRGARFAAFSQRIGSGKNVRTKIFNLFMLRQVVKIPAKPYVRPAVAVEFAKLNERIAAEIAKKPPTPEKI